MPNNLVLHHSPNKNQRHKNTAHQAQAPLKRQGGRNWDDQGERGIQQRANSAPGSAFFEGGLSKMALNSL